MGPLVQRVEARQVGGLEFEPKHVYVLANSLGADRLRDDDETVLKAPTDQDLGGRTAILRSDLSNHRMLQPLSARQRAVRLQLDSLGTTILQKFLLEQEGMELDLIDRRRNRAGREQFFQVRDHVVADPDRTHLALISKLEQGLPGLLAKLGDRPVDQVQVHVFQTECTAALLERPKG